MTCEEIATCAKWIFKAKQSVSEFARALSVVRNLSPKVVVELGSADGGSLYGWHGVIAPDATVVSVDIANTLEKLQMWAAFIRPSQLLYVVQGTTAESYDVVKHILDGRKVDLLYIDAAHSYDRVKEDYYKYLELCAQECTVMFHDTAQCREDLHGVYDFWAEIREEHPHEEFVEWGNEFGIGVLYRRKI